MKFNKIFLSLVLVFIILSASHEGVYVKGSAYIYNNDDAKIDEHRIIENILDHDFGNYVKVSDYKLYLSHDMGYLATAMNQLTGEGVCYSVYINDKKSILYSKSNEKICEFKSYWGGLKALSLNNSDAFKQIISLFTQSELENKPSLISVEKETIEINEVNYHLLKYSYLGLYTIEVYGKDTESINNLILTLSYLKGHEALAEDLVNIEIKNLLTINPNLGLNEIKKIEKELRSSDEYSKALVQGEMLFNDENRLRVVTIDYYTKIISVKPSDFLKHLKKSTKEIINIKIRKGGSGINK